MPVIPISVRSRKKNDNFETNLAIESLRPAWTIWEDVYVCVFKVHTCNPVIPALWRLASLIMGIPGQPGLMKETLSENNQLSTLRNDFLSHANKAIYASMRTEQSEAEV